MLRERRSPKKEWERAKSSEVPEEWERAAPREKSARRYRRRQILVAAWGCAFTCLLLVLVIFIARGLSSYFHSPSPYSDDGLWTQISSLLGWKSALHPYDSIGSRQGEVGQSAILQRQMSTERTRQKGEERRVKEYDLLERVSNGKEIPPTKKVPYEEKAVLETTIDSKTLSWFIVDPLHRSIRPDVPCNKNACKGLPCPLFGSCAESHVGISAVCSDPHIKDDSHMGLKPNEVFPHGAAEEKERDHVPSFRGNVYVMENVYVNQHGEIFDSQRHYIRGGCNYLDDFYHSSNSTVVTRFEVLASLVSWSANTILSVATETVPRALLLSKVLMEYPGIPIAFRADQDSPLQNKWLNLIGWPRRLLNVHYIDQSTLFFAKKLLVPAEPFCSKPSGSLISLARKKVEEYRRTVAVEKPLAAAPSIVFLRRFPFAHRHIPAGSEIISSLRNLFGEDQVEEFWGNLTMKETAHLLGNARLFIGPHGSGMANMLFLPDKASVLEIRPKDYVNSCFHFLAYVSKLKYYAAVGEGAFMTNITVSPVDLVKFVSKIVDKKVFGGV